MLVEIKNLLNMIRDCAGFRDNIQSNRNKRSIEIDINLKRLLDFRLSKTVIQIRVRRIPRIYPK
jgi:hypothetical protein